MEQIKELLEILKETPEMALWGIGLYFAFVIVKMASWVGAITLVAKQLITRFFNYKDSSLSNRKGVEIAEYFEGCKIGSCDYNLLLDLLKELKSDGGYIHESNIRKAIQKLKSKA